MRHKDVDTKTVPSLNFFIKEQTESKAPFTIFITYNSVVYTFLTSKRIRFGYDII